MSTDFSITPVGAPAAIGVGQPVSEATSNAIATDLPAGKAVTVAEPGADGKPQHRHESLSRNRSVRVHPKAWLKNAACEIAPSC